MNFPSTSALACWLTGHTENRRLARLLKAAKLRLPACVEDINYRQPRGLDRNLVVHLAACDWITNSQNVLITGPTGVGKTFIACALAHSACRHGFSARYYRVPRLLSELAIARGDGSYPKMLARLSKIRLLILDVNGQVKMGLNGHEKSPQMAIELKK
jgi:DNA replication protein DnaC